MAKCKVRKRKRAEEKKDLYRKQSFVLSFSHAEAPVPTPEGPGERIVRYLDLYPKKIK